MSVTRMWPAGTRTLPMGKSKAWPRSTAGSGADEAWFAIKRTINGADVRYIERIHPTHRDEFEDMASDKWWYLDCGIRRVTANEETDRHRTRAP